jgi:hypothetical protein
MINKQDLLNKTTTKNKKIEKQRENNVKRFPKGISPR